MHESKLHVFFFDTYLLSYNETRKKYMSSLERMLLENMLRFGPKNLTEWDQRRLKHLLKEQTTTQYPPGQGPASAAPPTPTATTNRQGTVNLGGSGPRVVDPSEWQITGFTAPAVNTTSLKTSTSGSAFFDAYRTYMDVANGMVGKTLLVFSAEGVTSINDVQLNPANIIQRIEIQSTYVPGAKAEDVKKAMGKVSDGREIRIWSTKQATRNFNLATKTVMRSYDPDNWPGSVYGFDSLQKADISVIPDGNYDVADPTNGYVYVRGSEYTLGFNYEVRQKGQIIGYALVNNDQDFVPKTEGYGTILTTKGFPEKVEWSTSYNL